MPSLRDVLADYRRQRAEKKLSATTAAPKQEELAELEQKAFEDESKRIADEQAAREKAAAATAKAAAREAADAAKARQIAENNVKEEAWRRDRRPMYVDGDGVIQSHYTDEEWAAEKAKKGAKLQKEKDDAELEKKQKAALAAVEDDKAVAASNDQSIDREGDRQALANQAESDKYRRVVKEYEQRLKDLEDGAITVPDYDSHVASIRSTITKANERLAALDEQTLARKKQALDFRTQQDQRKAQLEAQRRAIQRGELPPETAAPDPVQVQQARAEVDQREAQRAAEMAALEKENARLMSLPHSAADLSEDGQWHKDVLPQVQAKTRAWQEMAPQEEAAKAAIVAQESAMQQQAAAANQARQETQMQARAEREQQLRAMENAGLAGPARKLRDMDADANARIAVVAEMYPEDSLERKAAMEAIKADIDEQKMRVDREMQGMAKWAAAQYESVRKIKADWKTGESTDPNGIDPEGALKTIEAEAKAKGLDPRDVRHLMETFRRMDWSQPLSGKAEEAGAMLGRGLAEKAKKIGIVEPTRLLPDGRLIVNPAMGADEETFLEAIAKSTASKAAKDAARATWPELRQRYGETAADVLSQATGVNNFTTWRQHLIEEDQKVQGKNGFAAMPVAEQALLYIEQQKKRNAGRQWFDLIASNLLAGSLDIRTALTSVLAATTKRESVSEAAANSDQEAQNITAAQGFVGPQGLTAGIVGQTARMLPGMAATIATGSMGGAMIAGGVQTGGLQYAGVYGKLRKDGLDHETAWQRATISSAFSGAMTAALTKAFPGGATAVLNPGAAAEVKEGIGAMIWSFVKAGGRGAVDEVPQEVIDEAFSQLSQAYAEGRKPDDALRDLITNLPELIGAAGIMGAGGKMMEGSGRDTVTGRPGEGVTETALPDGTNLELQGQFAGASPTPSIEAPPAAASAVVPEVPPTEKVKPEKWAAAKAAVENFAQTTNLPPEQADKTRQKAEVLLKIAQGAKADSLDNDDLHLVGLNRDDAGKITTGHMSKTGWKKGPNPNGSPQPVETVNGEFVITDRQIERLRNKDVGLGALADAIALPAAERRAQILARPNTPTNETPAPAATQPGTEAGAAPDARGAGAEAVAAPAPDEAQPGNAPAVGASGQVLTPEQMSPQEWKKLRKDRDGLIFSPATAEFEHKGRVAQALKVGLPVSKAAVEQYGLKVPAGWVDTNGILSQAGQNPPALPAPDDQIPMEWAPPAEAGVPEQGGRAPEMEQRATEISRELVARGVDATTAQALAGDIVDEQGLVGDAYTLQMVAPAFEDALKARGWERYQVKGKTRYRPATMTATEKVPGQQAPTRGTAAADEVLGTAPANVPSSKANIPSSIPSPKARRIPLAEREDWRAERTRVLSKKLKEIAARRDAAMGKLNSGAKHPAQIKAGEETAEMIRRIDKLQELIDSGYGASFDGVVFRQDTAGGGFNVEVAATAPDGRATEVLLAIDLERYLENGSKTDAGTAKLLEEEMLHRVDLMITSEEDAIALAQAVHAARPGVFGAVWKQYFGPLIEAGQMPAKPPAQLSDQQAYTLFFEATRIIRQGSLTSENVEVGDVGLLRRAYLYLSRWIQFVRREMKKLPESVREEWQWRIDRAESLQKRIAKMGQAAEKAALDNVEPPERPTKSTKRTKSPSPDDDLEDELAQAADDAELAAASAEREARRAKRTAKQDLGPQFYMDRAMAKVPGPSASKPNIITVLTKEPLLRPSKAYLARKAAERGGRAMGGEWDWLDTSDKKLAVWTKRMFRTVDGPTNIDTRLQELRDDGYFGEGIEDVTAEMVLDAIQRTIDAYERQKAGGAVTDEDQVDAYYARLEQEALEAPEPRVPMTAEEEEAARAELAAMDELVNAENNERVPSGSVAARLGALRREGIFSGGFLDAVESRYFLGAGAKRVTKAQDAEYMAAVEAGDMATAQRLVDAAAKAAGYDQSWFHKTSSKTPFEVFDVTRGDLGAHFGTQKQANNLRGGSNGTVGRYFLQMNSPIRLKDKGGFHADSVAPQLWADRSLRMRGGLSESQIRKWEKLGDGNVAERKQANAEIRQFLLQEGFDGVIYANQHEGKGDSIIALTPNQIKSADPITRDESGNVIPLSKRFNPASNSILFSGAKRLKPSGPTLFGDDTLNFMGDKNTLGLFEQKSMAQPVAKEPLPAAPAPSPVSRPDHQTPRFWIDAEGNVRKAKKIFQVEGGRGTSKLEFRKKPQHEVLFTGTTAEAEQWIQQQGGILLPSSEAPDPTPKVSNDTAPAFILEAVTPAQIKAEAERKKLKEAIRARQERPLIGTMGDIGQMDMLGGNDLLSAPPVAKPSTSTTLPNAPATTGSLESDRPRNDAGDTGRTRGIQPAAGESAGDAGRVGGGRADSEDTAVGDRPAAGSPAADAGIEGAEPVQGEASRVPGSPAGGEQPAGSSGIDEPRAAVESGAELDLPATAPERPDRDEVAGERAVTPRTRQLEQATAQATPSIWDGFKVADADSIAKSVPMLLPQQQADVLLAERRFFVQQPTADDPRSGVLFTNGTGTGKTFTGLGIIKRFEMMGKGRILIVVPSQQKVTDWKNEGQRVMVKATPLKDTNDIGEGVVVTTYANMRDNWRLQSEPWDLVVYDESHNLSSNAQGTEGANIAAHELTTNKPGYNQQRKWIQAELGPRPGWEDQEAVTRYDNEAEQASKRIQYRADTAPDTKVVFLSATPFAYHKNLKYADGFLYRSPASNGSSGYNVPQGFDRYLVENFGYSMRTNRLTSPGPEVDVGLMEREWAERQFKQGSMTGRMIDVPFDYSREFILLDSRTGQQLDDGFSSLSGWSSDMTRDEQVRFRPLTDAFYAYWHGSSAGYTRRMQFLESIKVADAIDRMNVHLDMGRKIVLFHSYNNAEPVHPFQLNYLSLDAKGRQLAEEWKAAHPELVRMNFKRLENPRALIANAFGARARFFNGEEKGRDRASAIKEFNADDSGVDILMVQMDAGKEGISLHDVTGAGKQRVLMNAALPVKPTDAIQSEGRIYRIGVMSNAIQEYLVLHTAMERSAFGSKISTRTGTVENMALGKMARTLTDSFKSGYLNAHGEAPSAEQGLGGKKQDAAELLGSDMDRAKSYFYGRMKKTSRTKSAEGSDYFATPEPVGLTMVRFLGAKAGMDLLEPSAGHGAIARFFPDFTDNKFVEPSRGLSDELRIKVASGKVEVMPFEDLHIVNKFDGAAMNPPFGTAGKLAMEHVAKAAKHLRQGGRLVAIIPEGPAMQKRFDQWLEGDGRDMHLRASYGLPTVTFERAGTSVKTRIVVLDKADLWTITKEGDYAFFAVDSFGTKRTSRQGDAASVRSLAEYQGDFIGWSDQVTIENRSHREIDVDDLNELFDTLEQLEPPARITKTVATGEISSVETAPATIQPPTYETPAQWFDVLLKRQIRSTNEWADAVPKAQIPAVLKLLTDEIDGALMDAKAAKTDQERTIATNLARAYQGPAAFLHHRQTYGADAPPIPAPAPAPAPVPEASKPLYEVAETLHAKRGTMTYVAKFTRRIADSDYAAEKDRAKAQGGYYSAFKGNGAIPGFQFPSAEKRDAFVAGYGRMKLSAGAKRVTKNTVQETPFTLDNGEIQQYLEFPDVQVPASKQAAAKRAIRAAGEVAASPAYGPLPAARGKPDQRKKLDALRERAERAWRGLKEGDAEAVRAAFQVKDSFSTLLHDFTTREIPSFDIRGAIIENPADFAAFNLAVRSPYFESLKIAILDSANQVIHSQIVHVGSLNESIANAATVAGVIGAARTMYPKSKLAAWIIAHNHPSGDPSPSDADRRVTRRFADAGALLGLPMLDHVVTNGQKYFSFRESGMLNAESPHDSVDMRPSRATKPKLPILPTPERPASVHYGKTNHLADWEALPSGDLPQIDQPNKALPYLRTLRTADPDHYHVIYLDTIYLDTKLALRAVERFPTTLTSEQLFQRIALGAVREGAYGYTLSFPSAPVAEGQVNESSKPMPTDDQRRLVRRLKDQSETLGISLVDVMNTSPSDFYSWKEMGMVGEDAAEYGQADEGIRAPVDEAAHEAATSPRNDLPQPTEAQKEAGNYPKGHVTIGGHAISIENPAGSKRRPEWPALKDHYGYFKGTNAKDGDHVDVFIQPGTAADYAGPVHVVRQVVVERTRPAKAGTTNFKPTKAFDEYKVMLGYATAEEARAAYLRNYEPGWPGLERMTTHTAAEFARIKDQVFTVPADRVPGVRKTDRVLASGAKRAPIAALGRDFEAYERSLRDELLPSPGPAGWARRDRGLNLSLSSAAKRTTLDKAAGFVGKTVPLAVTRGRGGSAILGAVVGGSVGALTAGPVGAAYGAAAGAAVFGSHLGEKAGLDKLGSNKFDKFLYERVFQPAVWGKVSSAQEAVKKWLNKPGALNGIGKAAIDQTLPLWNVPREWLAHYHEAQRKAAWGREKAMDVIRALSHDAKVSDLAYPKEYVEDPSWRVRMFDAMEGKTPMTDLPEPLQKLAARLRVLLEETGRDLIKQGLLNLDTFNELKETGWMPRYTEDEAEAAGGSWLKAFKLGIKDMKAQRSTAWHIVDTSRKDPKERDQYAIVSREEGGKKNRWRFRNQQQRNAWYEAFVKREAVRFLQDGGPDVTNLLAALSKDEQAAVRDGIRRLTPEAVDLPGTLIPDLANVVTRAVELQRLRYKKQKPFEPDKLIKDPVYSVARYVMANTHNAATMELLKATAKNKEWVSDVSLEGYTEIPDNPRFGPLAKKFVRQDIATQVLEHVGVDGAGMQFYDSMLRKWKAGKLVLNPGSHVRDAVGNTVFAYLGGNSIWNPGNLPYYRDAITTLRDGGSAYAELIEMQVLGGDAFTTQVQAGLKGLLPDTKTVEDMDPGAIARLFMGFGAGIRGGYEYLSELRKLPDDFYKTAAYLKYKSQGMSPAEAAAEVRKWFPYYDRLGSSALWKQVSRFAMPFSAFFRESTRILGRAAMERPLALSTSLAFASIVTRYSMMMLGLGDDDEDAIKRSMRGKLKFAEDTPVFAMLLPERTAEGQLQQWDISAVMPFADLLGSKVEMREGEDKWTRFFRSMFTASPLTAAAWGWSTNTDAFSGRKIVQEDMGILESTLERAKDLAGDLLPPLTPFVGVHAATIENAGRRTGSLEMRNKYQSYLRAIVGLDVRSADPNLYTETKFFREQNNLPLNNNGNTYSTPLKSRLAKDIKGELIQDAPDLDVIAEAMARLEASGNPVRSPKQMSDLLDSLDPAKIIKQEFRRKLINSFSPEAKRVYESQQAEFQKASARVPSAWSEARRKIQYGSGGTP